jgi:hypothetical protein
MRLRIRRASISDELRSEFEKAGTQVVALALGLGNLVPGGGQFVSQIQQNVLGHQAEASAWLQEKRDEETCDKRRTEIVEWAILLFVVVGVLVDLLLLKQGGD